MPKPKSLEILVKICEKHLFSKGKRLKDFWLAFSLENMQRLICVRFAGIVCKGCFHKKVCFLTSRSDKLLFCEKNCLAEPKRKNEAFHASHK
jgi:hypothetical protein